MHNDIKFITELEITNEQWARNLFGLSQVENFIIALGSSLVENYVRQAYTSNQISKTQQDKYIHDIKTLREKLKKGIDQMKNENAEKLK